MNLFTRLLTTHSLIPFMVATLSVAGCAQAHLMRAPMGKWTQEIVSPHPLPAAGETLTYQISWWGVPVATATLSLTPSSGPAAKGFTLHCEGSSNAYLSAFYPARVSITSDIDEKGAPRRFEAYVKRRRRIHKSVITFDQDKGIAQHELAKGRSCSVPVGPKTQDGLSILYFARSLNLQVGQEVPFQITADGKNWHLTGRVLRVSEVQIKGVGRFHALEGSLELSYPIPFFQGAKAWVWFSADSQRIPLLARIHSRVGPVTVVLIKHDRFS